MQSVQFCERCSEPCSLGDEVYTLMVGNNGAESCVDDNMLAATVLLRSSCKINNFVHDVGLVSWTVRFPLFSMGPLMIVMTSDSFLDYENFTCDLCRKIILLTAVSDIRNFLEG